MNLPSPNPTDPLREAEVAFEEERYDRAIQLLGHCLRIDAGDRHVYDLTARALEKREEGGRQGLLFRMCAEAFEDARPFYELGFEFVSADLPHLARPILERATDLDPDDINIRVECAVAQAETGSHDEALDTLGWLPPDLLSEHPSVAFLDAWCRLLTGDADGAEAALDRQTSDPNAAPLDSALAERLRKGLARFRALGRPGENDLRDWHFIQYGAAILTVSDTEGMGGRFGVLTESHEDLGARLADLEGMLRDLEFPVSCVMTPDDPDSEVLGRVIAKRFRVPRKVFDPDTPVTPGTVLCAATIDDLTGVPGLDRRTPDLLIYVHRLNWTQSAPFTPDIVGLVAEAHFLPWHRTFRVDPAEKKVLEHPPDASPPPKIAVHVFRHMPDPPDAEETPWRRAYLMHRALSLYGGDTDQNTRLPFRQESPIRSQRFL